ncbi:YkvA family protein [uncultured Shewanella sp.]|uniref:YkvA family protein n=1 Tax=uncultured Shewanella sp. TaxID=173975 RepID=UPI0026046F1D|nr:YkvA family protein [uncultured Shewanella sp.]
MMTSDYSNEFSNRGFWSALTKYMKRLGRKSLQLALELYYAAEDSSTPIWAKSVIYSALGYLILPVDAIPDMVPGIGLSDDITILVAAMATVATHVKASHQLRAEERLKAWFS